MNKFTIFTLRKINMNKTRGYLNSRDRLRKGLKQVHIGSNVWLIGKSSTVDGKAHQVIYGPDGKEYHVWGDDVNWMATLWEAEHKYYHVDELAVNVNRHGNDTLQEKVKIYILTRILDHKDNWCFDLSAKPEVGSRVKVIYDNGTVRWLESFSGEFEVVTQVERNWIKMKPVGYRKSEDIIEDECELIRQKLDYDRVVNLGHHHENGK